MKQRLVGLAAAMALAVSGCAQTTGDLGRARQGVVEQKLAPAYDQLAEGLASGNVTRLPETPAEREMRDRMWRYYAIPLQGELLFKDNRILTRTAIISKKKLSDKTGRYYDLLRAEDYRSTEALYRRVEADIGADLAMMPGLFGAICTVQTNDRRRAEAVRTFTSLEAKDQDNISARIALNEATITQFADVLDFRYRSYANALEHLLAEEPDPAGRNVNLKLTELASAVRQAEANRYCGQKPASAGPQISSLSNAGTKQSPASIDLAG